MSIQVTWVVVADDRRATIYSVPRGMARLREVLALDRGGTGADFGAELARFLDRSRAEGHYDELVLVAGGTVLATLRDRLGAVTRNAVVAELEKDLMAAARETLQEEILRVL